MKMETNPAQFRSASQKGIIKFLARPIFLTRQNIDSPPAMWVIPKSRRLVTRMGAAPPRGVESMTAMN